ncbi:hypothetical protein PO124_16680 [Bacillus licheniformis]|nr:hypothetical protein [Bacillus licheniformis]
MKWRTGGGSRNAVYDLALKTEGIDAIISGHQHGLFPGTDYPGNGVIDNQKERSTAFLSSCRRTGAAI